MPKEKAPEEVRWDRMTAPQLRTLARRKTVVIIPLGATEQHGQHLPTQVDWRLAYEIAQRAARQMQGGQRAIVTPAIPFGMSEHHMSLGGTITLNYATMSAVVGCVVRSAARHGFKRIFVLNGHGGNIAALETIITELTVELKLPLAGGTYWHIAAESIAGILEQQTSLLHACEAETSMMMAVAADCVRAERIAAAVPRRFSPANPPGFKRSRNFDAMTDTGVIGDPSRASAAKGKRLLEAGAARLAEELGRAELWS